MKLYLAGVTTFIDNCLSFTDLKNTYCLESFYYANKNTEKMIPLLKGFLLDSGAFTFFSSGEIVRWEEYVDKYADFITKNNINHFFELDIDKLVGYENVLKLRKRLELKTGKQCIPVWHKFRGKKDFLQMCNEYKYVAIGGIVSGEIRRNEYPVFTYLINEAHKKGAKIHGLGFTNLEGLEKYHFDSVDSTAWTTGNRFGGVYQFNGKTLIKHAKPQGCRMVHYKKVVSHNFGQWIKFQQYAERWL